MTFEEWIENEYDIDVSYCETREELAEAISSVGLGDDDIEELLDAYTDYTTATGSSYNIPTYLEY